MITVSIREFDYRADPRYGARGINDGTKLVANRIIRCNNTLPLPRNKFRRASRLSRGVLHRHWIAVPTIPFAIPTLVSCG